LRILLVVEAFDAIGGVQEVVYRLATEFTRRGHTVAVATDPKTRHGRPAAGFVGRMRDGFEVFTLRFENSRPVTWRHPERILRNALVARMSPFASLVRRWRPSLVSAHIWNWDLYPPIEAACRAARVPATFSLHGFGGAGSMGGAALACLANVAAVIANSRGTRDAFAAVAPSVKSAHVIVGGVDVEAAERAEPIRRERPYLFCASRIELRYKRFDLLLGAFREVTASHPQVDLLIAGDGPDRAQVQALAEELGIAARVEFLGSRPQSELWRLYKGAEVTLMPGMGLVMLESVAVGTPVVGTMGTNVGVVPELVEVHSERFAIVDDNAPALARAVVSVLDDRALRARMGEEGRRAVQRFGWPSVGERYLEVFEACLAHK
jgi:glycosyltransferase involved in cell wall biosynthesis